jgi:hypothetical protein
VFLYRVMALLVGVDKFSNLTAIHYIHSIPLYKIGPVGQVNDYSDHLLAVMVGRVPHIIGRITSCIARRARLSMIYFPVL